MSKRESMRNTPKNRRGADIEGSDGLIANHMQRVTKQHTSLQSVSRFLARASFFISWAAANCDMSLFSSSCLSTEFCNVWFSSSSFVLRNSLSIWDSEILNLIHFMSDCSTQQLKLDHQSRDLRKSGCKAKHEISYKNI